MCGVTPGPDASVTPELPGSRVVTLCPKPGDRATGDPRSGPPAIRAPGERSTRGTGPLVADIVCSAVRAAVIQTTATTDRDRNLDVAGALVGGAVAEGAALVVLPEYFSVAGDPEALRAGAERLDGPTVSWAGALARQHGIWLVAGSFPEAPEYPGGPLHNTSCMLAPDGTVVAVYRKVHLFDTAVEGARSHESATFAAGDELCVVPAGDVELGLSICFDVRFPELYRILASRGATVVAVPAAFTSTTGPPHWEVLLRARAIEDQVFVLAAGQVGALPQGMPPCHGHSMIVDPWGTVLSELGGEEHGLHHGGTGSRRPTSDPERASGPGEPAPRRLPLAPWQLSEHDRTLSVVLSPGTYRPGGPTPPTRSDRSRARVWSSTTRSTATAPGCWCSSTGSSSTPT